MFAGAGKLLFPTGGSVPGVVAAVRAGSISWCPVPSQLWNLWVLCSAVVVPLCLLNTASIPPLLTRGLRWMRQ